jgi:hypothetical protein
VLCCPCRQDRSYLLQAFRFFVRNNFLLDYAAGASLQLPPPPEYLPAPGVQWGRPLEGGVEDSAAAAVAGEGQAAGPRDVRALLASVAKGAIDVELSDEEDLELFDEVGEAALLLRGAPAGASRYGGQLEQIECEEFDDEEQAEEGNSSGGDEEEEVEEGYESEAEEGQLLADAAAASPAAGGHPEISPDLVMLQPPAAGDADAEMDGVGDSDAAAADEDFEFS